MQEEYNVYLDRSGRLVSGVFFRFDVATDDRPIGKPREDTILSPRSPTESELNGRGEQYLTIKIEQHREKEHHRCPEYPSHVTEHEVDSARYRVFEEGRLAAFIIDMSEGGIISQAVSGRFAAKLQASGLTGCSLVQAEPARKKDTATGVDLHILNFIGRGCQRPESVRGAANACPYCGNSPLVCPACGDQANPCSRCQQITITLQEWHEGPSDKKLTTGNHATDDFVPPILEGARWDGSDFIYPYFITKRALDWLLSVHAAPFYAKPAVVCIDGMSDEQKKWLERAKRLVGE